MSFFFFQAEDGIRDLYVTGVQTCALPISITRGPAKPMSAPGSAITASPMKANEADTPPIVGSVRMEMNGCFAAVSWRSEERRVGKECRSWWSSYHQKKERYE